MAQAKTTKPKTTKPKTKIKTASGQKKAAKKPAAKKPAVKKSVAKKQGPKPAVKAATKTPAKKPSTRATSKKLPFAKGDYVVYPTHGVGKVTGIERREVAGFNLQLFVILFDSEKMTLRVPVEKVADSGLR